MVYLKFSQELNKYMDIFPYRSQLREFLTVSLDCCMKAVNARSGSIFLFDDEKKELILEIFKNVKNVDLEGIKERLGEGVAGKVALERKPCLVENIDDEPAFPNNRHYTHYRSKSFLSVPLEISGNLIGVINITDKAKKGAFDNNDLQITLHVCEYLSTALSSLKNYLEKQSKISEELTDELRDLKKSISQSKKFSSLGKLVGGLVHEINNPLDGVIRYVNLASDCVDENGIAKEYLKEAKAGLVRIARIVRSLLDFSWSLSPHQSSIDVNHVIEESLFHFSRSLVASGVTVKKFFSKNLPKICDFRLKLALNNIIKNAREAMKGGGVLSIYSELRDNIIEIRFTDTGEGIPNKLGEKIFDPFFTTKHMGEGSGLGLAITQEIVKRYKGSISFVSQRGQGTTFLIKIPVQNHGGGKQ